MKKETSHRSHELKSLGWNQEDITRYEELWEYSQRWGLINLERDDRAFLKKAEKLLPKIQPKRNSTKKSIEEKNYYLWLAFYLEQIQKFDEINITNQFDSVWGILIQSELNLLKKLNPVMGLPDTLKAKSLHTKRKDLIDKAFKDFEASVNKDFFDFKKAINSSDRDINKTWRSITENDPDSQKQYPLIKKEYTEKFRSEVEIEIEDYMKNNYPSLKESL